MRQRMDSNRNVNCAQNEVHAILSGSKETESTMRSDSFVEGAVVAVVDACGSMVRKIRADWRRDRIDNNMESKSFCK